MLKVVTNNPRAWDWWKESESNHLHVIWQSGDLFSVLIEARNLVHLGWRLVNHPLASSVKPNQTPYKTLVLVQDSGLDYQSLSVIESAIAAVNKLGTFPGAGASVRVLEDLQLIDLELCRDMQALNNLGGGSL